MQTHLIPILLQVAAVEHKSNSTPYTSSVPPNTVNANTSHKNQANAISATHDENILSDHVILTKAANTTSETASDAVPQLPESLLSPVLALPKLRTSVCITALPEIRLSGKRQRKSIVPVGAIAETPQRVTRSTSKEVSMSTNNKTLRSKRKLALDDNKAKTAPS